MLPDDLRTVPKDVRDFLEARATSEQFRRESVPETMRVRTQYARGFEHGTKTAINMRLVRLFGSDAVPKEMARGGVA